MSLISVLILCSLSSVLINTTSANNDYSARALVYLTKYGYTGSGNTSTLLTTEGFEEHLKSLVKDFQAFAGLEQTGVLNNETVELMNTPRCGVKDIVGHGATARRKKRYVLQGSRWRVKELTYRVSNYPTTTRLTKDEIDNQVKKAFSLWQDVTPLNFKEVVSGPVHIDIRFEKYEHGDGDPFDGPGGTLAHAYFPQFGGDIHMDESEYWTIDSFKGTNLLQTITHELGHSLGLSHSDVRNAIMAPFYRGWDPNLELSNDDIKAIQALYGESQPKPTPTTYTTTTTTSSSLPGSSSTPTTTDNSPVSLCTETRLDTMITTADGTTYAFQGDSYWRLTSESIAPGFPRKIAEDWTGLPANIDGGVTLEDGDTFLFKGNQYWKFKNKTPSPGYPKAISEGFPGIPNDIDAAFLWSGNGKVYFFKGSQYWKFDPDNVPHVRENLYPRSVSTWNGIPNSIEAALQWQNGKTYFFKGGQYWRFNDRYFSVDRARPSFPRNTGEWWFGCQPPVLRALVEDNQDGPPESFDREDTPADYDELGVLDVGNEVLDAGYE